MTHEQILIAIFLRNPSAVMRSKIRPEDFEDSDLAATFSAMRTLSSSGVEFDAFSLTERMGRADLLHPLLLIHKDMPGAASNLAHYEGKVIAMAKRRTVEGILRGALDGMETDGETHEAAMQSVTRQFAEMTHEQSDQTLDAKQTLERVIDYIHTVHEAKYSGKPVGVKTGLSALDKILGGLHKSDLVVVGAQSGMGKTAFALTVLVNAARSGFRGGFVSTEMSAEQVGMRMVSIDSEIPVYKLRDADLEENDYSRLTSSAVRMQSLPFVILDKPACKVSDIAIQSRAWTLSGGLDFIIVDYLTRLQPESSSAENRNLAVAAIATDLKTLARQFDIPVVALAQLNRGIMARKDKRPVMSDLRDSGVIEQEADQILFLYRDSVYTEGADPEEAEVIVEKNRHGPTGTLRARYVPELTHWRDRFSDEDLRHDYH